MIASVASSGVSEGDHAFRATRPGRRPRQTGGGAQDLGLALVSGPGSETAVADGRGRGPGSCATHLAARHHGEEGSQKIAAHEPEG